MLIHLNNVSFNKGLIEYYDSIRQLIDNEPVYLTSIDSSSLCISPMNMTSVMISCNWDKKMYDWFCWVNRNICLQMNKDTYPTTMVKLRIAVGMLNNITSLTDLEATQIHSNLTYNIHNELSLLRTDGLPF